MTNPSPQPLDIVAVAVSLAALIFGNDVAAIVGPYAVIVVAAVLGSFWSASRRPEGSRLATLGYLLAMVLTSVLFTVGLAEIVARHLGAPDARPFFAPVSLLIAGIGPDWPAVGRWVISIGRSVVERRFGPASPNDQPPPPGGTQQ